jgi:hypothetical protein
MAEVARWGSEAARSADRVTLDIRSRVTSLELPAGVTTFVVSAESVDDRDRVLVGGVEVSPGEPLAVTPGDTVVVALRPSDAVSLKVEGTLLRTSVAAGRRVLTESPRCARRGSAAARRCIACRTPRRKSPTKYREADGFGGRSR